MVHRIKNKGIKVVGGVSVRGMVKDWEGRRPAAIDRPGGGSLTDNRTFGWIRWYMQLVHLQYEGTFALVAAYCIYSEAAARLAIHEV
jgi:hypothetical protein